MYNLKDVHLACEKRENFVKLKAKTIRLGVDFVLPLSQQQEEQEEQEEQEPLTKI